MKFADLEKYPNEWLNTITHEDIERNSFPVIIDRDQSDADRITVLSKKRWADFTDAEKRYWYGVVKGAYNDEDMNRVQWSMEYIANMLRSAGASVHLKTEGKIWTEDSLLLESETMDYLDDIATLKSAITLPASTPSVPEDMVNLGFDEANAIEKILLDLESIIKKMSAAYRHSGVTVCGFGGLFL